MADVKFNIAYRKPGDPKLHFFFAYSVRSKGEMEKRLQGLHDRPPKIEFSTPPFIVEVSRRHPTFMAYDPRRQFHSQGSHR